MRFALAGVAVVLFATAVHAAGPFRVGAELWDRPRSGDAVMREPAVRQAMGAALAEPGSRIVLHHSAGREALLQAEELRAWLMALAFDAERIALATDLEPRDPVTIEIRK